MKVTIVYISYIAHRRGPRWDLWGTPLMDKIIFCNIGMEHTTYNPKTNILYKETFKSVYFSRIYHEQKIIQNCAYFQNH